MPALVNQRWELFAQAIFKGATSTAAYAKAGYRPSDANCRRLKGNDRIMARVAELQAATAKKLVETQAYDAATVFARIRAVADAAHEVGDHKEAGINERYIAKCLGYEDSPTLTHEHLRGKPLTPAEAATSTAERDERAVQVIRFPHLIRDRSKG